MYVSWVPSDSVVNVDESALVVKYTCGLFRALSSAVASSGATLGLSSLRMEDRTEAWSE